MQQVWPLLLDMNEVVLYLGINKNEVLKLAKSGEIEFTIIGDGKLNPHKKYFRDSCDEWIARQRSTAPSWEDVENE